jgi:hypothetical protein
MSVGRGITYEEYLVNQKVYTVPLTYYGERVKLGVEGPLHRIVHIQDGVVKTIPIISYPDGMKVGCTFITNEALGKLYDFQQEYKNRHDYLEHQSGS